MLPSLHVMGSSKMHQDPCTATSKKHLSSFICTSLDSEMEHGSHPTASYFLTSHTLEYFKDTVFKNYYKMNAC